MSAVIADPGADVAPIPRGKKKLIVIAAAALALVLALGGGAVVWLKQRAAACRRGGARGRGGLRARGRAQDRSEECADLPAARPVRGQPGRQGGRPLRPDRHHARARHRHLGRPDQGLHAGDPQRHPDGPRQQERASDLMNREGKEQLAQEIMREAVRPMGIEAASPEPITAAPVEVAASAVMAAASTGGANAEAASTEHAAAKPKPGASAATASATRSSTSTSRASSSNERPDPLAGRSRRAAAGHLGRERLARARGRGRGRGSQLRPGEPGPDGPRAHAGARDHQRALRQEHPRRPVRLHPEEPRGLDRADARPQVQRLPARDRGADQLQHRLGAAAARPGPGRVRPAAGVRGDRRPLRRRRQVPDADRGTRLLGHRAADHPSPGRRGDGRLQARLGRHLSARARVRALGDAAAVRQRRPAVGDRRLDLVHARDRRGQRNDPLLHSLRDLRADPRRPLLDHARRPRTLPTCAGST